MKKKLCIISSYDELCGNATYADCLKKGLEDFYSVDVLRIDMRFKDLEFHDQSFIDFKSKLKDFDYVNIQFEPGLLGKSSHQIIKNFKTILENSRNLLITIHRLDIYKVKNIFPPVIKRLLRRRFKESIDFFRGSLRQNSFVDMTQKIIRMSIDPKVSILVHTEREKNLVEFVSKGHANVVHFPIAFLNASERENIHSRVDKGVFKKKLGLDKQSVCIGIFGFVSSYKGYDTLFSALRLLPENYHVIISGGQHPQSIRCFPKGDPYILDLIEENKDIFSRIHFLKTNSSHEQFLLDMASCDLLVLPYHETGQSGSGIAALTMDLGSKAIFSQNLAFLELSKYVENSLEMFSLGNYLELSQKIEKMILCGVDNIDSVRRYNYLYNLDSNCKMHVSLFEDTDRRLEK